MRRALLLVARLALLLSLASLIPRSYASVLSTQYSVLVSSASLAPQLVIDEQSASPGFPEKIGFRLKAHGFAAARATLSYEVDGDLTTGDLDASLESPTGTLDLRVTLDLTAHYIPPGAGVSYYWTLTGGAGGTVETPAKSFTLTDDRYAWHSLSDTRRSVTVSWYQGSAQFGDHLVATATAALDRLQHDIGAGLQRPATIWVYPTQDELLGALPANLPEWVGGKSFPPLAIAMVAVADDDSGDQEMRRLLPHELTHLVLYQATRNPYNTPPTWLEEGLAVHNDEIDHADLEAALRKGAEEGRVLPLAALSSSFGADEEGANLAYGQSLSVVDFILKDPRYGPGKLASTIAAFRRGVTYDDALKAGLGVTTEELDAQWRASLPYKVVEPVPPTEPEARASQLLVWVLVPSALALGVAVSTGILALRVRARRRRAGVESGS